MNFRITWKRFHKWVGLVFSVLLLIFCVSGIVLNHRELFSSIDVKRNFLPPSYHLNHYNNGIIKGTLSIGGDSLLAYGNCGIWLTDRGFKDFKDYNQGLPNGIDNRNIKNILKLADGELWCATQFGVFKYIGEQWRKIDLPDDERISDLTLNSDSTSIVVLSRSRIFCINFANNKISTHTLKAPENSKPTYSLFKTFWMLHSGEIFGITGRIIVDIVAVIISFLCITGIILFCMPYSIKWRKKHNKSLSKRTLRLFKWNFKWHNRVGYITIVLTIIIAFTGMCLRPPLMIPLVLTKTSPIPYTAQDTENYWQDKLRGIRWNDNVDKWLISTSDGFFHIEEDFISPLQAIGNEVQPPISPMGITVFEKFEKNEWLIGSFSGLYRWNQEDGKVIDFITGKEYNPESHRFAVGDALISGISNDLGLDQIVIFDYAKGNEALPEMSQEMQNQPMSLWNVALELHVGRCYNPILGPFSVLFVFLSGLLLILILVSGIIIRTRKSFINNNNS